MDDKIIIAIVAAVSAVLGGIVTAILGPIIRYRLEAATTETVRKREQIAKWRQMLLDVDRDARESGSPSEILQVHSEVAPNSWTDSLGVIFPTINPPLAA